MAFLIWWQCTNVVSPKPGARLTGGVLRSGSLIPCVTWSHIRKCGHTVVKCTSLYHCVALPCIAQFFVIGLLQNLDMCVLHCDSQFWLFKPQHQLITHKKMWKHRVVKSRSLHYIMCCIAKHWSVFGCSIAIGLLQKGDMCALHCNSQSWLAV